MKSKETRYFLKVTNPQKGTRHFLTELCNEFLLQFEEYWQKKDDSDLVLHTEPVYARNFNHVVLLYSGKLYYIEFVKYLIQKYMNKIEALERAIYEVEQD